MTVFNENESINVEKLHNILSHLYDVSLDSMRATIEELTNIYIGNLDHIKNHWEGKNLKCEEVKNYELKGIDIPFWIGPKSEDKSLSNKKIIILGQEPLRTKESFEYHFLNETEDIELATPFAYHLNNSNKHKGRLGTYWQIINSLSENNFVYVTDYSKIWFKDFPKLIRKLDKLNEINSVIWKMEIETIKPDLIITFGNAYKNLLTERLAFSKHELPKEGFNYQFEATKSKVLPLLHPSGNAARYRKSFFEKNSAPERGSSSEKYLFLINEFLLKGKLPQGHILESTFSL